MSISDDEQTIAYLKQGWDDCFADNIKLRAQLAEKNAEIERLNQPMSCGHAQRYVVSADEGTSYCMECAYERSIAEIAKLQELLKQIEWIHKIHVVTRVDGTHGDWAYVCPICDNESEQGHKTDCALAAVIK